MGLSLKEDNIRDINLKFKEYMPCPELKKF